jgi:hypothetical protein
MKLAIMQPYLFPYIGYFQLINAVDTFIVYDNIKYTKKGWINRNRILVNGKDEYISVPLKKDSDFLDIVERRLSDTAESDKKSLLRKIKGAYAKAPNFEIVFPLLEGIISNKETNLFRYIDNSIRTVCHFLAIETPVIVSSSLPVDHSLRGAERVIDICRSVNANQYINTIGGIDLYSKTDFAEKGIELCFLRSSEIKYPQFENEFVPWLSIIDVMMFNDVPATRKLLSHFSYV